MAVAAETFEQLSTFTPEHYEAEVQVFPQMIPVERLGLSADELPWVAEVRTAARDEAERIMDLRRLDINEGRFEAVPLDVDAVSTATKARMVAGEFGNESAEYALAHQALVMDYSRKWAEATRKNTYEYFGVDEQHYDEPTGMLFADGFSVDEMLVSGITPIAEAEEKELRINDFVQHKVKKSLLGSPEADKVAVVRVTPCPDWAIESYKSGRRSAHGGYAPEIEKLMVHYEWFDQGKGVVYHEQIGVSGLFITTDVMMRGLQEIGSRLEAPTKTDIHGEQVLVNKHRFNGAFDFMRVLDQLASEASGQNIFMGEVVPADYPKDYAAVIREAEERRVEQKVMGEELAVFVERLDKQDVDHAWATIQVENHIQDKLLQLSEHDAELARLAFDEKTAQGFAQVRLLEAQGRQQEADRLRQQTRLEAPPASSCGAGSCGLESVDLASPVGSKMKDFLGLKKDETLLKDKERSCQNCGKKEIYYAFNSKNVKKGCGNCGELEVNGQRSHRAEVITFRRPNRKTQKLKAA